jgi:hypothetical protein
LDDLSPPRRPLFLPVVIATVFLSVIGMSGGLVLGSRHERLSSQAGDPPVTTGPEQVECPAQMHATANRLGFTEALTQVLRVRTVDGSTTVWICGDADGRLFYQANRGGLDGPWVEGQTALFLSDVRQDDEGYHAVAADGNVFSVNTQRLQVDFKDGKTRTDPVVEE